MLSSEEIIDEVESLPIDQRLHIVDRLLQGLNKPDPDVDRAWIEVAKKRLEDMRAGRTEPIPGEVFLDKLKKRLSK